VASFHDMGTCGMSCGVIGEGDPALALPKVIRLHQASTLLAKGAFQACISREWLKRVDFL
jgi:hypothetical protein